MSISSHTATSHQGELVSEMEEQTHELLSNTYLTVIFSMPKKELVYVNIKYT